MNNKHENREKEIRAISTELNRLYRAKWDLGLYKLPKPLRHGWYKQLGLRHDISRRRDVAIFQSIIHVAGIRIWGRNKKQVDLAWTKDNAKRNDIQFPGLRKIDKKRYRSLTQSAKKLFEGVEISWTYWRGTEMIYHCRVPHYYFILSYTKAYITHRTIIDSELEQKISELEALLRRAAYYDLNMARHSYTDHWHGPFINKRERRRVKMALGHFQKGNDDVAEWVYQKIGKHY